jgi:thioredoxin 1
MEADVKRNAAFAPLLWAVSFMLVLCFSSVSPGAEGSSQVPQAPVEGKVTMVDIGAKKCIPCKMMAPIMKELEEEYGSTGKAAINFIDVWENPAEGRKFGIKSIPTQIFFDKDGKEVYRHEGFLDKNSIITRLEKLGVK